MPAFLDTNPARKKTGHGSIATPQPPLLKRLGAVTVVYPPALAGTPWGNARFVLEKTFRRGSQVLG